MSSIKELEETFKLTRDILLNNALKEYSFEGVNGPVIGIHGAGLSGWTKGGLRAFMLENNVKGFLMYNGILTRGVDSYLPFLDEKVKKYPNATLVGFSSGGFIALRYAQKYGWNQINNIVTIATPFNGNPVKFDKFGQILKETTEESPLLKEIVDFHPPEGRVTSIFAREDILTPSPESLNLNWKILITDAMSHEGVQNNKKYFEKELVKNIKIN
jgi:hypothetical protein